MNPLPQLRDALPGESNIDEIASYEPELLDWIMPSQLGERSLCFFECMDFPMPTRAFVASLEGLSLVDEHFPSDWRFGRRHRYDAWEFQFVYRGSRFLVESNSHAGLGYFWVNDPGCPQAVLLEVLEHFLGSPQDHARLAPQPSRGWRGELKDIGCAVILVVMLVGFSLLLIWLQR